MCCHRDDEETKAIKDQFRNKDTITCYKRFKISTRIVTEGVEQLALRGIITSFVYEIDKYNVLSDYDRAEVRDYDNAYPTGFHVSLSLDPAVGDENFVFVPVTVKASS